MHGLGQYHLAINPWNIFFKESSNFERWDHSFMIGDYGISLHTEERKRSKVSVGGGHTRYLAPEVVQSGANYSGKEAQADIYSLGMVFKDIIKHIGKW